MKSYHTDKTINYAVTPGWVIIFALLALVGIICSSCSSSEPVAQVESTNYGLAARGALAHASLQAQPGGVPLLKANTEAGDALAAQLLLRMGSAGGILNVSLVELNDLDKSSLFGQTCTEQIASRLSQHGFKVLESRLGAELRMERTQGEFMLTRDSARLLNANHDAHAVLLGVYSETSNRVFLSVRVVRLNDNAVIAGYEYYLPKYADVASLLNGNNWSGYSTREQAFTRAR
jgi:TolB-like protein